MYPVFYLKPYSGVSRKADQYRAWGPAGLWLPQWFSLRAYELRAWVMQGADGLA